MLLYIRENMSVIRKLITNQFGAAFLALLLAFTSVRISETVYLITSILSVAFLLYLHYATLWEEGAKARIRVEGGREEYNSLHGLWLGLAASVPNLIFGILTAVFTLLFQLTRASWADFGSGTVAIIGRLWQAMYMGIIHCVNPSGKYIMLLIPLPAILVCFLAYRLGYANCRLLGNKTKK